MVLKKRPPLPDRSGIIISKSSTPQETKHLDQKTTYTGSYSLSDHHLVGSLKPSVPVRRR